MNTSVGFRQAVEVVALHLSVASAATGLTSPDGAPQVDIADRLSGELNGMGVGVSSRHIVSVRTLATLPFLATHGHLFRGSPEIRERFQMGSGKIP